MHPHGSHLKLSRARYHLDALARSIDQFIKSRPYTFRLDPHPAPPLFVMRGYINQRVPPSIGLTIGDFAHNARSGLDHVVFTLSDLPQSDVAGRRRLQFPICDKPEHYEPQEPRQLIGVPEHWQDLIRSLQPCEGAPNSELLSILRDISNTDKHQVITPVGSIGREPFLTIERPAPNIGSLTIGGGGRFRSDTWDIQSVGIGAVTEDGAIVAHIMYAGEGIPNISPDMEIEIAFGERHVGIKGKLVVETLARVLDHVTEVVEQFKL